MIEAIRLQNFRSMAASGWIKLAPITVLLGRNSSGKSSFLRLLPLLKQSLIEETKEPFLWYGRTVDFGTFNDVLSNRAVDPVFGIEFKASMIQGRSREVAFTESGEQVFFVLPGAHREIFLDNSVEVSAGIQLRKRPETDGAFVSQLSIELFGSRAEIDAAENGDVKRLSIDGHEVPISDRVKLVNLKGRFFPVLSAPQAETSRNQRGGWEAEGLLFPPLLAALEPLFHGNTSAAKRREMARQLRLVPIVQFYDHLTATIPHAARSVPGPLKSGQIPEVIGNVWRALFARYLLLILRGVNSELARFASSVRYLAPVRASASRYYRFQELAVDEIDPQGENVPMFINSLTDRERKSLTEWMKDSLGFSVTSSRVGGHTALFVHEGGGSRELNLADTGFGYSQILPVLLQIWLSFTKRPTERARGELGDARPILAIEQPELHLHPHYQAALADVFSKTITATDGKKLQLSYVVETHSEHFVNRLGSLVEAGALDPNAVSIVLFDKERTGGPTKIRQAKFSSSGVLEGDWPFGFFLPET